MKLYSGGMAPNPRRVSIFMAEKGIEFETQQFDIAKGEHKGEVLAKISPRRRLPVLELDDGTILTETIAICRYLEALHPQPALMGVDDLDKAVVEMWQRRLEFELFLPVAFAFRHLHPLAAALEDGQVSEWGEKSKTHATTAMKRLDHELADRQFFAGERFSVADITAITAMQFLKPARIEVPEGLNNLNRWFAEVMERPSTKW